MAKVSKAKVLLLDDDLDLQALIRDYFTPRGYVFLCHSSAELALNDVVQQSSASDPIDLVITDFRLPSMNGIELIEQMKKIAPQIPIILITAHSSLDLAIEAIDKGAYDFVVKPIQFPQLAISMERAVYLRRLQLENQRLKSSLESDTAREGSIVAKSPAMRSVIDLAKRVAKSDATVLISGESGTGKEVLAQLIHSSSPRAERPFVAINCSAIPEALLESELFGHAKGSFTGATDSKPGLFEEAEGGTLFLDEIGDLSLPLQAKLLRVIQERKIKRVGENKHRDINVRLLAASHKNLPEEVQAQRFREDLFFRLNVIPIKVPPLREHREDILPLAEHFLARFKERNQATVLGFSKRALRFFLEHEWKGNVRELENAVERAVVLCDTPWIEERHFHEPSASFAAGAVAADGLLLNPVLDEDHITRMLEAHALGTAPAEDGSSPAPRTEADAPEDGGPEAKASPFVHLLRAGEFISLETLELRYIKYVVNEVKGVKDHAAKILQVDRKTLYRKLEALEKQSPVSGGPAGRISP